MGKCIDTVVNWMIRCNVINKKDKELYGYAVHSFILLVSPLILAAGIGFFSGSVKHGVVLVLPFMVLRKFSGGYHAKSLSTCIWESGFLLFLCITLSFHVRCDWGLATATAVASVSLILFSPIDNENRRLDADEKMRYKKATALGTIFFVLLDLILFFLGKYVYTSCISVGILLTAGLQVPCVIKKCVNRPKVRRKCCLTQKGLKSWQKSR